jgi:hypothetical protein
MKIPAGFRYLAIAIPAGFRYLAIAIPAGSRYLAIAILAGSRNLAIALSTASSPGRYLARQFRQPADCTGAGGPAAILAWIRSSPSAAGSIVSTARLSARRNVCSSMV